MTGDDEHPLAGLARRLEGTRLPPLAMYKERCLQRRVAVRMRACGVATVADYVTRLDRDPAELERLLDALTINVTEGFRNPKAWDRLDRELQTLPMTGNRPVTAWSAGCATGEEAWTLALLLARTLVSRGRPLDSSSLRVDATDVDPAAVAAASAGRYPASAFAAAPAGLLDGWAAPAGRLHVFSDRLRPLVRFEVRDLGRDPPPASGYDLIVCRNVLIYFARSAQISVLERFADALGPGGLLFLGKVESVVGTARRRFVPVDIRERLFRRAA